MHIIILVQPDFPDFEKPNSIEEFIKDLQSKQYSAKHVHPSWNRIRAREIKLYDLQIPSEIEKEVLKDLLPYEGHKISRLVNIFKSKIVSYIATKILINRHFTSQRQL